MRAITVRWWSILLVSTVAWMFATPVAATDAPADETEPVEQTAEEAERDQLLRVGADTYSQLCSSCHQPGGAGLEGVFPPLVDNPNLDDATYIRQVIDNGREGEITVAGSTYDGVMPSFSTLADDEVEALVVYIQADFAAPAASQSVFDESSPGTGAGTELPFLSSASALIAFLLAAAVVGLVLAPRLVGVNDRLTMPWLDASLKTASIVVAIVAATVVIPDLVLQWSAVSSLDRRLQDLIGLVVWGGGLLGCLWFLWYAHRESRI